MIKILTIVGARPQIIKASAVSRAIKNHFSKSLQEIILHTGQHYDHNMSEIFFNELGIPKANANLKVGSKARIEQLTEMQIGISKYINEIKPNCVLVYGDTNSTNAGSVIGAKSNLPVIHIEAGLRSYNNEMPEEENRIISDRLSALLFCPTKVAIQNLVNEGFSIENPGLCTMKNKKIYYSGDVMFDNSMHFEKLAGINSGILNQLDLKENEYLLATVHRDYNTDNPIRMRRIFRSFLSISDEHKLKLILPIHPRTKKILNSDEHKGLLKELIKSKNILMVEPVSFLDMIALQANCRLILTDSGGVQKESYFFKKPCVVLRTETEWTELVENGNNILAINSTEEIINAFNLLYHKHDFTYPLFYGDGKAAEFICKKILSQIH